MIHELFRPVPERFRSRRPARCVGHYRAGACHPLPANYSPPTYVALYPGTLGYEAVATCLASP
ncbi:MAG: hypothetical protein E5V70_12015, partial [Mesorhizobium sp.]